MKFIVSAQQLILQDVEFIVEAEGEDTARFLAEEIPHTTAVQLFDARDEEYVRNIVTGVRLATEDESR
jgi:hypothetical protein